MNTIKIVVISIELRDLEPAFKLIEDLENEPLIGNDELKTHVRLANPRAINSLFARNTWRSSLKRIFFICTINE